MPNMLYDYNKAEINARRSIFRIPHTNKTTFNAGDLIPAMQPIEVLPGDTFKCDLSAVCRELTLLAPVMDNAYIQFDAFFVPMRLVWNNTKQFFGENENGIWTQTIEREIPHENYQNYQDPGQYDIGSIGDYFGIAGGLVETNGVVSLKNYDELNTLPLRAYALIYNYWYLNEATQAPIQFSKGDVDNFGVELQKYYNSKPLKVNRYADLFTSALPSPQKGESVLFLPQFLPVVATGKNDLINQIKDLYGSNADYLASAVQWANSSQITDPSAVPNSSSIVLYNGSDGYKASYATTGDLDVADSSSIVPINLVANASLNNLNSINDFRIAAATQQYFETLARFGSRYSESIYALFGIKTKDATIQVPQYLGGIKHILNVDQVLATAQGTEYTVGSTGAFSNTGLFDKHLFTFSADEYGYIIILAHVRTDSTYSQGIPKLFSKRDKFSIYNPLFANIGNVPIKNREIFVSNISGGSTAAKGEEVFGYQEAWYEYKFIPNTLTAFMRAGVPGGLSNWSYGRVFASTPVLNSEFTQQTADEVDRTIAVSTENTHQFKLDMFFNITATRVMPVQSIPGLRRI